MRRLALVLGLSGCVVAGPESLPGNWVQELTAENKRLVLQDDHGYAFTDYIDDQRNHAGSWGVDGSTLTLTPAEREPVKLRWRIQPTDELELWWPAYSRWMRATEVVK